MTPGTGGGAALEISLDLDMVSAICPNCHILLVESNPTRSGRPRPPPTIRGQRTRESCPTAGDATPSSSARASRQRRLQPPRAWPSPWPRGGSGLRHRLAAVVPDRDLGRRYPPARAPGHPRLDPDRVDRLRLGVAGQGYQTAAGQAAATPFRSPASTTPRSTCPRSPDPFTPAWCSTPVPQGRRGAGLIAPGGTSVSTPIVAGLYALAAVSRARGDPAPHTYPASYPYRRTPGRSST